MGITSKGDFENTRSWIRRISDGKIYSDLDRYGKMGVDALARATPVDSGISASSWTYIIKKSKDHPGIQWHNTNVVGGTPVVILLQYGHATGTGGYVQGHDFINPAMAPVFDQIINDVWKKVST